MLGCACDGDHDPACASRKAGERTDQPRITTGENSYSGFVGKTPYHIGHQPCDCGWRHDPACAVAVLDAQSGERPTGKGGGHNVGGVYDESTSGYRFTPSDPDAGYGDTGGASRFFYTAKASRDERERGLDGLAPRGSHEVTGRLEGSTGQMHARAGVTGSSQRRNTHPTVKPIDLMQWLCRLVCPPNGLVLDPFVGSGTTGAAALREDFRFLGIDQDAEYVEIARRRIIGDAPLFNAGAERSTMAGKALGSDSRSSV